MDPVTDELDFPPASSHASSHFPLLEPVSGATLFELETARREKLKHRGCLRTGCVEIDDKALLGGLERGEVVGASAEEAEFGLLVGLQTVAHAMVFGTKQRAAIITTLAATAILPTLRDVIRDQVSAKLGPAAAHKQQEVNGEVRRCLEQISISRVFDVEGLWEVLSELEMPPSPAAALPVSPDEVEEEKGKGKEYAIYSSKKESALAFTEAPGQAPLRLTEKKDVVEAAAKPVSLPSLRPPPRVERTEVGDSEEDEDEELSLSPSPPPSAQQPSTSPPPPPSPSLPPHIPSSHSPSPPPAPLPPAISAAPDLNMASGSAIKQEETTSHVPDIILITHFSSLLTNLFTRSADNKTGAHTTLQLLSSHLRYLSRSPPGPLILILNTTTSTTSFSSTTTANPTNASRSETAPATKPRPLEPTLRSIFNPIPPGTGGGTAGDSGRRNKPAFGAIFTQFLDLHLLCTRVPRTKADAEALFAPPGAAASNAAVGLGGVKYCWIVEVLLDELGAWQWDDDGKSGSADQGRKGKGARAHGGARRWTRRSREQRWGAVDVRSGVRLVDAFQGGRQETWSKGPVRLAAGFGGPPPRGL
ncbi:hypothetical protein F4804DRAFT_322252 [Jackrogersella minutella]|nr:hypothetical protein F4804DRAFT_322252 [Jackrogersella minutella]